MLILTCLTLAALGSGDDWTSWRGVGNTGVAPSAAPTVWSDDENIKWSVDLPGRGFSTPLVVGDLIYVTTAVPLEEEPEPPEGDGRRGRRSGPQVKNAFMVIALERGTGKEAWRKTLVEATPHEGYHRTYGSHASASCTTDGERLYVPFGSWGMYALSFDGELIWSQDLGVKLEMRRAFGEGAPPVVSDGVLVQMLDQEGPSAIVALDSTTGKELWRKQRDEPSCWATPLVTEVDGVKQVITSGTNLVRSYRLGDGELLWQCGGLGLNAIPSIIRHGDLVLCMTGFRDPRLMAVRLGGKGDLTGSESVVWQTTRATSYTASPVLVDGRYYAVTDRGFISCWDAATGEEHYVEQRLPRGSSLKASPIAAGEYLYVATEAGDVHLIELGDEYVVARTNTLSDQFFVASPVVTSEGELLLRSRGRLFCIE
jgi:outer membrane protein assembly factor BamB